jgi:hypothetical protein
MSGIIQEIPDYPEKRASKSRLLIFSIRKINSLLFQRALNMGREEVCGTG